MSGYTKLSPIHWQDDSDWLSIFVDTEITKKRATASRARYKVGLMQELDILFPGLKRAVLRAKNYFDLILTYDEELVHLGKPFWPYVPGGNLLRPNEEIQFPPKLKRVSMSVSEKFVAPGHKLRHEIVSRTATRFGVEVFGRRYRPYVKATYPYEDFQYSIVVENVQTRYNLTEKLIEPFLCRTIPIYCGATIQADIFDQNGVFVFNSIAELEEILQTISSEDYQKRHVAIERNFQLAQSYMSRELNVLRAVRDSGVVSGLEDLLFEPQVIVNQPLEPGRVLGVSKERPPARIMFLRKFDVLKFRVRNRGFSVPFRRHYS